MIIGPLRKVVRTALFAERKYLQTWAHFRRDWLECGHIVETRLGKGTAIVQYRRCEECGRNEEDSQMSHYKTYADFLSLSKEKQDEILDSFTPEVQAKLERKMEDALNRLRARADKEDSHV